MGSTTNEKLSADERRKKTLKSVAKEFAANGFEGTRMADLAEAAGISEAMLVKLYGSKENLYQALIKQKIEETPGTAFPEELRDQDPEPVLNALAQNLRKRCEDDPAFLRLLYYSALEDNELSDLFYEARIEELQSQVSAFIREQVASGTFREVDADEAAIGFIGMVCQVLTRKHVFDFPLPAGKGEEEKGTEDLLETFVTLFLEGMRDA